MSRRRNRSFANCCRDLGEAQRRAGQFALSLETFQRAFDVARSVGAERPNGRGGHCFRMADVEYQQAGCEQRASLQRSAPRTCRPIDKPCERNLPRPRPGHCRAWASREEAAELAREAVELARQVGEPSTLCYVLELVLHMSSGPAHIGERLSYAIECLEYARAAGDLEKMMFATGQADLCPLRGRRCRGR